MKILQEALAASDPVPRFCAIWQGAEDAKWYLSVAPNLGGKEKDAEIYGPFTSFDKASRYLSQAFAPPGRVTTYSGPRPVPSKSPSGDPIQQP